SLALATRGRPPKEGSLTSWDLEQRTKLGGVRCGIAGAVELAHRNDGVCCRTTLRLCLWTSGGHLRNLRPQEARGICVALAPDGRFAAFNGQEGLVIWDLDTGQSLHALPTLEFFSAALAPKGTALVLRTRDGIVLHSLTGEPSAGRPMELPAVEAIAL